MSESQNFQPQESEPLKAKHGPTPETRPLLSRQNLLRVKVNSAEVEQVREKGDWVERMGGQTAANVLAVMEVYSRSHHEESQWYEGESKGAVEMIVDGVQRFKSRSLLGIHGSTTPNDIEENGFKSDHQVTSRISRALSFFFLRFNPAARWEPENLKGIEDEKRGFVQERNILGQELDALREAGKIIGPEVRKRQRAIGEINKQLAKLSKERIDNLKKFFTTITKTHSLATSYGSENIIFRVPEGAAGMGDNQLGVPNAVLRAEVDVPREDILWIHTGFAPTALIVQMLTLPDEAFKPRQSNEQALRTNANSMYS